jgi:8-oxo-dGTP diphosphatase
MHRGMAKKISSKPRKADSAPGGPSGAESRFLAEYRQKDYARPSVAVDLVVFSIIDADLKVLLIRRKEPPFQGCWALPGGFVRVGDAYEEQGEDLEDAAQRELSEETGLPRGSVYLEQLGAFGKPYRDPRMRVISVAFYALVRPDLAPFVKAGTDAAVASWTPVTTLPQLTLAFDHAEILDAALSRVRSSIDSTNIAFELVPKTFTIPELRSVYEVVHGTAYDPGNFRRRFHRMLEDDVIEQAPGKRITASRPAKVYRFKRREEAKLS